MIIIGITILIVAASWALLEYHYQKHTRDWEKWYRKGVNKDGIKNN